MSAAFDDVLGFLVAAVLGVGPLAVLIALLNRRDRKAALLVGLVARYLPAASLRSDVAVAARASLVGGGGLVQIEVGRMSPEELWGSLAGLREALPPRVRLVVEGHMPPAGATRRSTHLMVELVGDAPPAPALAPAAPLRRAA